VTTTTLRSPSESSPRPDPAAVIEDPAEAAVTTGIVAAAAEDPVTGLAVVEGPAAKGADATGRLNKHLLTQPEKEVLPWQRST
jgi:hypothetical protein